MFKGIIRFTKGSSLALWRWLLFGIGIPHKPELVFKAHLLLKVSFHKHCSLARSPLLAQEALLPCGFPPVSSLFKQKNSSGRIEEALLAIFTPIYSIWMVVQIKPGGRK